VPFRPFSRAVGCFSRVRSHRTRSFTRTGDHEWVQRHVSHYLEGDLTARARRRLERHAAECPECSRGIRAMKGLLRLIARVDRPGEIQAPASVFDRVRAEAITSSGKPDPRPER
jgi:anti-sigma factor RsiW